MKIVCDKNMPYAEEAFSTIGDVVLIPGRAISAADVKDADVLVTRSTTKINASLLTGSSLKFYGSGVIGVDHIDFDLLASMGIQWATAPGCNAVSVGNYVTAALLWLGGKFDFELASKTIGVIGVGNVGKQVCRFCSAMGMRVLANDPPRQRNIADFEARNFVSRDQILAEADFITCHVPLNKKGTDKTVHLLGADELSRAKEGVVLINAARGPVVDNQALLDLLGGRISHAVIDCWEGEPVYRADLMEQIDLGTPHIAGHAYEGKVNGTAMVYRAACDFLGIEPSYNFDLPEPPVPHIRVDATAKAYEDVLRELVLKVYNIKADSDRLRLSCVVSDSERSSAFDAQRSAYPMRRQFEATRIEIKGADEQLLTKIRALDFSI
ncbi:MAG: 4-phosphoerythronate dehydrogenase [Kiritimatiellae bacterium]|jgi:erythronate-4-phosphate dehydrogenase|nr:4-phosphoerythronate dehydrogenase [Kiritimatiellia bacterium]